MTYLNRVTVERDALEQRVKTLETQRDELVAALHNLSEAVIVYGRTDMDDAAESEWDAVLAADKAARAALAKVTPQPSPATEIANALRRAKVQS